MREHKQMKRPTALIFKQKFISHESLLHKIKMDMIQPKWQKWLLSKCFSNVSATRSMNRRLIWHNYHEIWFMIWQNDDELQSMVFDWMNILMTTISTCTTWSYLKLRIVTNRFKQKELILIRREVYSGQPWT